MADYRYLQGETTHVAKGILRTTDSARIPPAPGNRDWEDFLIWLAVPNTPDPSSAISLSGHKRFHKQVVDQLSEAEYMKDLRLQKPTSAPTAFALARLVGEAVEIQRDAVAFDALRHPMVNAAIGTFWGASGALVATAVSAWWDGISARVGATLAQQMIYHNAVNGAASIAAVDAVPLPTWPGGGAGE